MRRRLLIFQTMRHDSAKLGLASSVCAASSTLRLRRSKTRASAHGAPGEHHEDQRREREDDERPAPAPPVAMIPAVRGPMIAPTAFAARWKEYTRGRLGMS